jgi:anaerobic magnesium-protoporphyrin IX monomethyl ester cyclase
MKILLINPPRWNELVGKNPSIIEAHRGFNPPLGLLYIASTLRKGTPGHHVDVWDAQARRWTYEQLEARLQETHYDVVGISAMTFTLIDSHLTAKLVKKLHPDTKVVMGGTHVHLFPEETIGLEGIDFAFMGEAEFGFSDFINRISRPGEIRDVPGLLYRDRQGQLFKSDPALVDDLDRVPFPDRTLLDIRLYNSLLGRRALNTTIISSRGCPYRCAFCDRPRSPVTSHFRCRSARNVADELSECAELGIRDFLFYDDTLTVNRKRVLEICDEILSRRLRIRWDIRTRVDTVDRDMLDILKRAGCAAIHYGVEAGNDRVLKVIKKGFTTAKVKETFAATRKAGIETLAYFMIGLPTEEERDIQDSFALAKELKPDYAHFTIFSPYPGTDFYAMGLERGLFRRDVWRDFAKNPTPDFRIPIWEEHFSRDELFGMLVKFYKRFYLRPRYILSRVKRLQSWDEFAKKARAGLSVIQMKKRDVDHLQ